MGTRVSTPILSKLDENDREDRLGPKARIWIEARKRYLEICRTTRFRRWRNLFTWLIMVFCRLHRRFPCFCATVNGLTTNRLDLHRITNAFTTNLFVCDQASTSVPLFPPSAIPPSIYLSQLRGLSPLLSSRFAPNSRQD